MNMSFSRRRFQRTALAASVLPISRDAGCGAAPAHPVKVFANSSL
jgi:hypothetical protein